MFSIRDCCCDDAPNWLQLVMPWDRHLLLLRLQDGRDDDDDDDDDDNADDDGDDDCDDDGDDHDDDHCS